MEEIKYKITIYFKILKSSEGDSTKIVARSKDSEVQKHLSYIDQQLDTIQGMKYEVQDMTIDSSVEDESRRSMWQGCDKCYMYVFQSEGISRTQGESYQKMVLFLHPHGMQQKSLFFISQVWKM